MVNLKLKISFQEYLNSVEQVIKDLITLEDKEWESEQGMSLFLKQKNEIDERIASVITESFNDPDDWIIDKYQHAGIDRFIDWHYQGKETTLEDNANSEKRRLYNKRDFLTKFNKILPHLDIVLDNTPIVSTEKTVIEDVFYLILFKLKQLKDDNYHSIKWLLHGNGIFLVREEKELKEIVEELERSSFIITNGNSAQITIKGELQLGKWQRSRNRKKAVQSKNSIDEVTAELKKLGLGQEILFDELEELKKLSSTLNKKNWKQLVKGKLVDLTLSKIIDLDTAKFVFSKVLPNEDITNLLTTGTNNG